MSITNFMRDVSFCVEINLNYSKFKFQMHVEGLTGLIKFDNQGQRSVFELEIIELASDGIKKIGNWNSSIGLNISRDYVHSSYIIDNMSLQNKSFIVLTALVSTKFSRIDPNIKRFLFCRVHPMECSRRTSINCRATIGSRGLE